MLENRSSDQMLGALQSAYPDLDGVPPGGPPRVTAAKVHDRKQVGGM